MLEEERYREWCRPREDMELDDLKVVTFDPAQFTESLMSLLPFSWHS